MSVSYDFLIGHGTENDFVLLPDHDGRVHGALTPDRVRALCDRRAGIGGDGVLRVIRTAALGIHEELAVSAAEAEWFMDYRNADGSTSEMCGNGVRVFARHLLDEGLATLPIPVGTRAGIKTVTAGPDHTLCVDMGEPGVFGESQVHVGDQAWTARHIDMGNPHAVAFVDDLADAGPLLTEPAFDPEVYPEGVNIEFVQQLGDRAIAMRVHERGAGETRSCGTGACAAMVATALARGEDPRTGDDPLTYAVDVPGGRLQVTWTPANRVLLSGPAVIVARGETDL